jgi:hypothetical protein
MTLQWTNQRPTVTGWYWVKRESISMILNVILDQVGSGELRVVRLGHLEKLSDFPSDILWYGPLVEPE